MPGSGPQSDQIEVGIEGETTPSKLEPYSFREDVVRVKVHPLEHEILHDEPQEEDAIEQHSWVEARSKFSDVMRREGKDIQAEHDGADQVEEHLGVHRAVEELPIFCAAKVEIGEERAPGAGCG
jgi:hypothetical protein